MTSSLRPLLAGLLLAVMSGGCQRGRPEYFGTTAPRHPPDELWINNGGEPEWIDPNKCSDSNGGDVIWNTFAGLVEAHPKTLAAMPEIARSWDVSDDGTVYTFHLRPSKWSDGQPLTARDFEYSFKRILDPKTASKYVTNGYILKNGEIANKRALIVRGLPEGAAEDEVRRWAGRAGPIDRVMLEPDRAVLLVKTAEGVPVDRDEIAARLSAAGYGEHPVEVEVAGPDHVGVEALDELTLRVELENPIPYFLNFLTFYSFMPVPQHVIRRLESEGLNSDLWTRPEHVVSNGAYVLKEWKFRQYMLFEKNPLYWNAEEVKLNRVKALMIESYNTALNMYHTGEIDWPGGNTSLPAEFMDHLKQYQDFHHSPYLAEYFYWVNTEAPPLDNVDLRRALSLAIDRQALVDHITRASQIPTQDLVPDGLAGYEGLDRPIFDPPRARRHLAAAGYESGADVPPITLIYNTSEGHKQIAEAIQQMWKKELGVEVAIENQEWKVYLKNAEMMNFQMARMGWIGDYADPYTFLELLTTECGNNHSNWSNAEYDEMLRRANREQDPQRRLEMMREAEALAMEQQPVIPLYVYTRTQMIKPYLKGIWGNYQDRHLWKYIWIDRRYYDGVPAAPLPDPPPPEPEA